MQVSPVSTPTLTMIQVPQPEEEASKSLSIQSTSFLNAHASFNYTYSKPLLQPLNDLDTRSVTPPGTPPCSPQGLKKLVQWNESDLSKKSVSDASTRASNDNKALQGTLRDKIRSTRILENEPKPSTTELRERIQREVERLEKNIQVAVRKELTYLNLAQESKLKREEGIRLLTALSSLKTKVNSQVIQQDLLDKVERVKCTINDSIRAQNAYHNKAKMVHDKRYRWTRIIEHTKREFQKKQPSVQLRLKALPPLGPRVLYQKRRFGSKLV